MTYSIEILKQTLVDWPFGTIIGTLMIFVSIIVLTLVLYGLFIAIDSWFRPKQRATGRVCGKQSTFGSTEIIQMYNATTRVTLPWPVFPSDKWSISIEVNGQTATIPVSREEFNSIPVGTKIPIEYVIGRISGDLYLPGFPTP